jgi:hypothetical protein
MYDEDAGEGVPERVRRVWTAFEQSAGVAAAVLIGLAIVAVLALLGGHR